MVHMHIDCIHFIWNTGLSGGSTTVVLQYRADEYRWCQPIPWMDHCTAQQKRMMLCTCTHVHGVLYCDCIHFPLFVAWLPSVCDTGSNDIPEKGTLPHVLCLCQWNQTVSIWLNVHVYVHYALVNYIYMYMCVPLYVYVKMSYYIYLAF